MAGIILRLRRRRGRARRTTASRGRYVFARPPKHEGAVRDLAVDATLRAAALDRVLGATRSLVDRSHLRRKVRRRRDRHTVILVLDTSDSMADHNQLHVARIALLSLLASAERRKDRVALITFADTEAEVTLEPTSAIDRARRALDNLSLGGATPLASGLYLALRLVETQRMREPGEPVEVMVFSDGEGNVSPPEEHQTIEAVARMSSCLQVHPLFIDTTGSRRGSRAMRELAATFGGAYRRLHGADGDELAQMITQVRVG
ncbi:MAG: VWA domain-containing protein [Spirochaetaceae bacterium]|nr:MAG: VWA domain-containing protein [Spirochaetaceae bacterium]